MLGERAPSPQETLLALTRIRGRGGGRQGCWRSPLADRAATRGYHGPEDGGGEKEEPRPPMPHRAEPRHPEGPLLVPMWHGGPGTVSLDPDARLAAHVSPPRSEPSRATQRGPCSVPGRATSGGPLRSPSLRGLPTTAGAVARSPTQETQLPLCYTTLKANRDCSWARDRREAQRLGPPSVRPNGAAAELPLHWVSLSRS